jgi:hypothetical protein
MALTMRLAVSWVLLLLFGRLADEQTAARIDGLVLDDATGAPVAKAVVLLDPGYVPGTVPYGAVTDSRGSFSMQDISPSKYGIKVERGGYLAFPTGVTIDVLPGEHFAGITLKLTKQGIIAGKVIDPPGLSSSPNPVRLWKTTFALGYRRAEPLNPAFAAADGSFMVGDLAPGRYYLEKPSLSLAEAIVLDVTAGNTIRDVQIRSQPAATYRISGAARNSSPGRRMPENRVSLETRDPSGSWVSLRRSARINPQTGAFTFNSVALGDYRLNSQIAVPSGSSSRNYVARQEVHVDKQSATGISLGFTPMAIVNGTVSEEAGLPPRAQSLYVGLMAAGPDDWLGDSAQVPPKTTFRLQVMPGQYRVFCGNAMENVRRLKAILFNGRQAEVDSKLNIPTEGGKLELILGGPGREIVGIVRDAAGRSVAGARVAAWAERGELRTADTDAMGRFIIHDAPRGQVHVAASESYAGDFWMLPSFRSAVLGLAAKLPLEGPSRVTVELAAIPRTTVEVEVAKLR